MRIKKILAGTLASLMTLSAGFTPAADSILTGLTAGAEAEYLLGDVNFNGKVDLYDCIHIANHIIGSKELSEEAKEYADINANGVIDIQDSISAAMSLLPSSKNKPLPIVYGGKGESDTAGGITCTNGEARPGETVTLSIAFDNEKTYGCYMNIAPDSPLTIKEITNSTSKNKENGVSKVVYVSGSSYETEKEFAALTVKIDEDAEPGDYNLNISIPALDDGNGYLCKDSNITVTGGKIHVKPNYGVSLPDVKVPFGKNEIELPISAVGTVMTGCNISVDTEAPLSVSGFDGAASYEGNSASFASAEPYKNKDEMGKVKILIDKDAEDGTYPLNLKINSITGEDGELEDPVIISGSVTYEPSRDAYEYSTAHFDKTKTGVAVENVTVPYGTKAVDLDLYMLSDNITSCGILVEADEPLSIKKFMKQNYWICDKTDKGMEVSFSWDDDEPTPTTDKPFETVRVVLAPGTAPGKYDLNLKISGKAIDDEYFAEDTVCLGGQITVSDPEGKGVLAENVSVPYGSESAEMPLKLFGADSKKCVLEIGADSPLSVVSVENAVAGEETENGKIYTFTSDDKALGYDLGTVKLGIAPKTKSGKYPVAIKINELDENGEPVETTEVISGNVIVLPDVPSYSGGDIDTDEQCLFIENAVVPYGTTKAELGLYVKNSDDFCGLNIVTKGTYPLEITKLPGANSTDPVENGIASVYFWMGTPGTDKPFDKVIVNIASDAKPGIYRIDCQILQIATLHQKDLKDPSYLGGYIIIKDEDDNIPDPDELIYEVSDDGKYAVVTGCKDGAADIFVPSVLGGLPVKEIGKSAFEGKSGIKTVTLPASLEIIGEKAFSGCKNIRSIKIPASVETIGSDAFSGCSGIKRLTIPASVKSVSGENTFSCENLMRLFIENPDCVLTGVKLEPDATVFGHIGSTAEKFAKENDRRFMDIDGEIPEEAPENISYEFVKTDDGDTYVSITGCDDDVRNLVIPNSIEGVPVKEIAAKAFSESNLRTVKLPDSLTVIQKYAFEYCKNLQSVDIPDSVTSIGMCAFESSSLESIVIPKSVTTIEKGAFENCGSLNKVTIPDSVKIIEGGAFLNCSSLESIDIPNSVESIGYIAFYGCSSLKTVKIPASVKFIGYWVFMSCKSLESVTILNPECEIEKSSNGEQTIPTNVVIYGAAGSTAEKYAQTYGNKFVDPNAPVTTPATTATTTTTSTTTTTTTTTATTSKIYQDSIITMIVPEITNAPATTAAAATTATTVAVPVTTAEQTTVTKLVTSIVTGTEIYIKPVVVEGSQTILVTSIGIVTSIVPVYVPGDYTYPATIAVTTTTTTETTAKPDTSAPAPVSSSLQTIPVAVTEQSTTAATAAAAAEQTTAAVTAVQTTAATEATTVPQTTAATEATTVPQTTAATEATTVPQTTAATEATTVPQTTTTEAVTTTEKKEYFAPIEDLCEMALKDYKDKNGVEPAKSEAVENEDNTVSITLTDENGNVLDTYTIDPYTGIGESSEGKEVNLPQTGNNVPINFIIVVSALMITAAGAFIMMSSGVIRRKKESK